MSWKDSGTFIPMNGRVQVIHAAIDALAQRCSRFDFISQHAARSLVG